MTTSKISFRNEVFRKLIHLSSLWMVVTVYVLTQSQAILLFSTLLMGFVVFEYGRRHIRIIQYLTSQYLNTILRTHENQSMTGAFYVVLATLLSVILFDNAVAIISIAIMILSDTFAALIGRKYGKVCILDKSLEGCTAFFLSTVLLLKIAVAMSLILVNLPTIMMVSLLVTIVELLSSKLQIDDNLSIVLASGFLLTVMVI
tara:strand:+ start:236 stop:841 length:606 start_codon:yes stop_codon:yes gene_type:complete